METPQPVHALSIAEPASQPSEIRDQRSDGFASTEQPSRVAECECELKADCYKAPEQHYRGCPIRERLETILALSIPEHEESIQESKSGCTCGYDARNNERESDFNCPVHFPNRKVRETSNKDIESPCCAGVDTPGVGFTHATDCTVSPNAVTRFPGDERPEDAPPSLRRLLNDEPPADLPVRERDRIDDPVAEDAEREVLLAQLLFAARNKAERDVLPSAAQKLESAQLAVMPAWCRECQMSALNGVITHGRSCWTGRILSLVAALCELGANKAKRKEPEPELAEYREAVRRWETKGQRAEEVDASPRGLQQLKRAWEGEGQRAAEGGAPVRGDFGEPWGYEFDPQGELTRIIDAYAQPVLKMLIDGAEGQEWAARIVDCVSSMAGVDVLGKGFERAPKAPAAINLLCLACGQQGGVWEVVRLDDHLTALLNNERSCVSHDRNGRFIYAHRCEKGGKR